VQVTCNGVLVSPACVAPARIDLGDALRPGPNVVEIELTTTLKNRVNSMAGQDGFRHLAMRPERTQAYGLVGPVRLLPYVEAALDA